MSEEEISLPLDSHRSSSKLGSCLEEFGRFEKPQNWPLVCVVHRSILRRLTLPSSRKTISQPGKALRSIEMAFSEIVPDKQSRQILDQTRRLGHQRILLLRRKWPDLFTTESRGENGERLGQLWVEDCLYRY
jgi:hypothetical protein